MFGHVKIENDNYFLTSDASANMTFKLACDYIKDSSGNANTLKAAGKNEVDLSNNHINVTYLDTPINEWNVSNITDMSGAFSLYHSGSPNFNQDISSWDVRNVTNMSYMFAGGQQTGGNIRDASSINPFNQPIGNWDISQC